MYLEDILKVYKGHLEYFNLIGWCGLTNTKTKMKSWNKSIHDVFDSLNKLIFPTLKLIKGTLENWDVKDQYASRNA